MAIACCGKNSTKVSTTSKRSTGMGCTIAKCILGGCVGPFSD